MQIEYFGGELIDRRISRLVVHIAIAFFLATVASGTADETSEKSSAVNNFDRTVAPILASRCLECHSGKEPAGSLDLTTRTKTFSGGDSGAPIVVGKPEESLLWEKIEKDEMPPKHPLPASERESLRRWIEEGAQWGTEVIDPYRFSTASHAGYDWWSFQPLKEVAPPEKERINWVKNEIDLFVLEKLHSKNLEPSPPADPRALIRRLYFDLTGLPPPPEAVDAFVANPSDDAYSDIVDQLLASPQYGERWAQHWLDVVRYGESGGFERNEPRENSWHYRDWVIQALNQDMPYHEFVQRQLSGDLLEPGIEGASAAGFLVAGVHNTVVGSSERMRKLARQDELEELAGTVGQTFLGLTVNCARCHSHKFDPVSTEEYYRFISALDGVNHGEREFLIPEAVAKLPQLKAEINRLETERTALLEIARKSIDQNEESSTETETEQQSKPLPISSWNFDHDFRDQIGNLHGEAIGSSKLEAGALVVDGKTAYVQTSPLTVPLAAKTLEAWVLLDNLDQQGGGVISLETEEGGSFDAIVYGEQEKRRWMAGSNGFTRTKSFLGLEEPDADKTPVHIAITYSKDGLQTGYRNGVPYGKSYQTGHQTFGAGKSHVVFGLRHSPAGGNRMLAGRILRANLYDRALTPDEIAASAEAGEPGYISEQQLVAALSEQEKLQYRDLQANLERLRNESLETEAKGKRKVYSVVSGNPEVMRVHLRGDVTKLAEEVAPGGIAAVGGDADFGISASAPDRERRLKLSDWMTDRQNGLFLRVIANRLWHYHFGTGIVETPNDFGFNGGRPSHPELLDWLAIQLRNNGMKWKPIHRLIVLSATYRQSSSVRPEGMQIDAGIRLLWRSPPRRLEGEALRDGILFVTGLLDLTPGGPGYQDVTVTPNNGTTYYEPIDEIEPAFRRRTIYRFVPRGGRSAILDTFDCPDPSVTAPRRQVTTTPLQALSLLNNEFILEASEKLAERVSHESGSNPETEVRGLWKLTLGREPDDREIELSLNLMHKHGAAALARALLNSNEFIVLE